MKIEIWSDFMCPFCYIGKRRFEKALAQSPNKNEIEIEWKSFQLNPRLVTEPGKSINQYLCEIKGISLAEAQQLNEYVTKMALEEGLAYDFDRVIVANTFDAHRILQLAKVQSKPNETSEQLFSAYFIEGKNIADHATLVQVAVESGMDKALAEGVLNSNEYANGVEKDIYEARQVGVRGVPYFIFNDHYAVSGAQSVETFITTLKYAYDRSTKMKVNT